jgi:hypothetical protein
MSQELRVHPIPELVAAQRSTKNLPVGSFSLTAVKMTYLEVQVCEAFLLMLALRLRFAHHIDPEVEAVKDQHFLECPPDVVSQ